MFGRLDHAKLEEMKKTIITILSQFLLTALLISCAPTPAPIYLPTFIPTSASTAASSAEVKLPVVQIVETYYKQINAAQSPNDLGKPWDLLSTKEQCNPRDGCDLSYFQTRWWEWKVIYKIYECGSNTVIVEESRYPREADPATATLKSSFVRFQLIQGEEKIFINKRQTVIEMDEGCVLAIDGSAIP